MRTTLGLSFGLLLLAAGPALAEDLQFNLVNKTGVAVTAFHLSHSGTDDWEENLIEGGYLDSGYEIPVNVTDGRTTCEYDIRAEFKDGDVVEDYEVDLCELGTYTLE
jgi:hypothetical protein